MGYLSDLSSIFRRALTMSQQSAIHSIAYVTAPSEDVAKQIARYSWQGKLEEDQEVLMIIKTRTSRLDDLIAFVKYDLYFEKLKIFQLQSSYFTLWDTQIEAGNQPYLDWISQSVPEKQ